MPQIEVTFDIDANGIVNVSAKDKATGKEQQIRIQASGGLSDEDIERMVKEAEANSESDKARRETVEVKNQADSAIHGTEKMLSDHGDKISEDDRRDIDEHIAALKTSMEGDDVASIKAKMEALQQASMKLGEAMYKASQEAGPDAADAGATGDSAADNKGSAASDDVVDADFEEVDDQNRDNKSA